MQIGLNGHLGCFKTPLHGIPSSLKVPSEAALVYVVAEIFSCHRGYLMSSFLSVGICRRIFLEYMDAILPVHPIEVVPEAASGAGRPGTPWEGPLTFLMSREKKISYTWGRFSFWLTRSLSQLISVYVPFIPQQWAVRELSIISILHWGHGTRLLRCSR